MGRSLDDFSEWLLQQTGEESIAPEARIIIDFIVEKDGALSHVKILQSNAPDWVGNVINAVALSPKWEPGKNSRNQPVRTRCIIAAVNHSGDSDSTGAICGNIMGLIHGYDAIPSFFKENLELLPVLEEVATDLYIGSTKTADLKRWKRKYIDGHWPDTNIK